MALAQLEKLIMNKGDIDTYIATFDVTGLEIACSL